MFLLAYYALWINETVGHTESTGQGRRRQFEVQSIAVVLAQESSLNFVFKEQQHQTFKRDITRQEE